MARAAARSLLVALLAVGLLGNTGPVVQVSTTLDSGVVSAERSYALAARFDGGVVVAWQDGREGRPLVRAWLARGTDTGQTLDPQGLPLDGRPLLQWDPAPGCLGAQCVVAWQQGAAGVFTRTLDARTGRLGPSAPTGLPGTFGNTPALASDGLRYALVSTGATLGVDGVLLQQDGTVAIPARRLLAPAGSNLVFPVVAATRAQPVAGARYLVAAGDPASGVVVVRAFDTNLAVLPDAGELQAGRASNVFDRVAATATPLGFAVAWFDGPTLSLRRLGTSGQWLDAAPLTVDAGPFASEVAMASDERGLVLLWVSSDVVVSGARLFHDGGLDTPGRALGRFDDFGAIDKLSMTPLENGRAFVLWQQDDFRFQARSRRLGEAWLETSAVGGLRLSDAGVLRQVADDVHDAPKVAPTAGGFFVSFDSLVDQQSQTVLVRVDAVGRRLGTTLVSGPAASHRGHDLASLPSGAVLVATAASNALRISAFDAVGASTASQVLLQRPDDLVTAPGLAVLGAEALVAIPFGVGASTELHLEFIDARAQSQGSIRIPGGAFSVLPPAVAASSSDWGVLWADERELRFYRVTRDGRASAPVRVAGGVEGLDLASDGTDYFAVWTEQSPATVLGRALQASPGPVLQLDTVSTAIGPVDNPAEPAVVFAGRDYVVTWANEDGGGSLDVFQRSVSPGGTVGPIERVVAGPQDEGWPTVGASAGGLLVAWLQRDPSTSVGRVFARGLRLDGGPDSDGGTPDGGFGDAGQDGGVDAGPADGGLSPDAGLLDVDGGAGDAGVDGGAGPPRAYLVGCGCGTTPGLWGLALLLVVAARRGRSARHRAALPRRT